jgi:hypothetical protein
MPAHPALSRSAGVKPDTALPFGAVPIAHDAPVIILSYAHSGAEVVQQAIAEGTSLVCTAATGILPLCEAAALSWEQIDNRKGTTMSRLAASSIRALVSTQLTVILAASGGQRWCELANTAPSAASAFLRVFPAAKLVCVHRACTDVISAISAAHPWGLDGPVLSRFALGYPGNTVAALGAYWAWATEQLLEFETDYPQAAIRLRYEDAVGGPSALNNIRSFLHLTPQVGQQPLPGQQGLIRAIEAQAKPTPPAPTNMLPGPLSDRIRHLQSTLGYDAIPTYCSSVTNRLDRNPNRTGKDLSMRSLRKLAVAAMIVIPLSAGLVTPASAATFHPAKTVAESPNATPPPPPAPFPSCGDHFTLVRSGANVRIVGVDLGAFLNGVMSVWVAVDGNSFDSPYPASAKNSASFVINTGSNAETTVSISLTDLADTETLCAQDYYV